MKIGSNKNLSKAKPKSRSTVTTSDAHATPNLYLIKTSDKAMKTITLLLSVSIMLPTGIQKSFAKQQIDEKLAIKLFIMETGITAYHFG